MLDAADQCRNRLEPQSTVLSMRLALHEVLMRIDQMRHNKVSGPTLAQYFRTHEWRKRSNFMRLA
ncbi:hypothetical protein [Sphingomonas sp. UYP23]